MKIEKCPFCGSEAETFEASEDSFSILCTGCGVETPYLPYLTEAIAAWNRRTGKDINVTTNADRIRAMSDEELHKFLLDFEAGDIDYAKTFCDLCCKVAAIERKSTDCEGCLLRWLKNDATLPQGIDWLRQPVKEETL